MEEPEDLEEERESENEIGTIQQLTKAFKKRLRRQYDVAVAITGDEGTGKTTLAVQMAMDLDKKFSLERNILFDPDLKKLYDMVYKLPSETAIVVDETIRVAYKRRWQTANNIFLNELYTICRYRRQASFFCIPRFNQLDSDFQKRIFFWIHIPFRGWGVVFMKEDNPFSGDPWNVKESYKRMQRSFQGSNVFVRDVDDFAQACVNLPNYVGIVKFGDLADDFKLRYQELKKPFEFKQEQAEPSRILALKNAVRNCVGELHQNGWTHVKLSELTGLSSGQINNFLKDLGVRESDLKEKKVVPKFFLKGGDSVSF